MMRCSSVKTMRLTRKPDAPTMPNFTNWRTPRRSESDAITLRNPIPICEQHRKQAEQRQRKRQDDVIDPRTLAPPSENGEHREEDEGEARHRHQARRAHRG